MQMEITKPTMPPLDIICEAGDEIFIEAPSSDWTAVDLYLKNPNEMKICFHVEMSRYGYFTPVPREAFLERKSTNILRIIRKPETPFREFDYLVLKYTCVHENTCKVDKAMFENGITKRKLITIRQKLYVDP
ncbi:hypothetical protein M514_00772 [Trichuris suis]|uniref:MSP domain-containing protein n=1 Tax=Trichuris suis TaxID=68888 RepID=A0A085N9D2_9BILA|nr:hypothetical protein M513_00772 [Trichuris suis]KFD66078.1 hypothetical protein M514_00772 [Trichuris suis]